MLSTAQPRSPAAQTQSAPWTLDLGPWTMEMCKHTTAKMAIHRSEPSQPSEHSAEDALTLGALSVAPAVRWAVGSRQSAALVVSFQGVQCSSSPWTCSISCAGQEGQESGRSLSMAAIQEPIPIVPSHPSPLLCLVGAGNVAAAERVPWHGIIGISGISGISGLAAA